MHTAESPSNSNEHPIVESPGDAASALRIRVAGVVWRIYERDSSRVPGALAPRCLIFEAPMAVRRAWQYPATWRELSHHDLVVLGQLS